MNVKKVWDFIREFPSFEDATNFFYQNKKFGSDLKLPQGLDYKHLITAMLILKFPQDILLKNQWDQYLEITSRQLVEGLLSDEPEERSILRIKAFVHVFTLWKKQDKQGLLEHLSSMYLISRNTMFLLTQNMDVLPKEEQKRKQEEIDELVKYMNKIKSSIDKFDTEFLKNFLEKQKEPEEVKEEIMKQVSQKMYKTFWKWLLSSLQNEDYEPAFKNLEETILSLRKLGKLEFDLDYYKHLVKQKLFSHNDLLSIGIYLVSECKKRGAPEDDKYTDEQLNNWKYKVEKQESLSELFVEILQLLIELTGRINYRLYMMTQKLV